MKRKRPNLQYQLVVIGAGPAGMSAAVEAAKLGLNVAVFDMQANPGGQIYRNLEANLACETALRKILGNSYFEGAALIADFRRSEIDYFPESTVWHLREDGAVGVTVRHQSYLIDADYVLVASGAMERPAPFPGWTLPGVLGAGAAQTLIKSSHAVPSGPTALAGTGPLAILVAYQLMKMGVELRGLLLTSDFNMDLTTFRCLFKAWPEGREVFKGLKWLAAIARKVPIYRLVDCLAAKGSDRIEQISFRAHGSEHILPVRTLLVHDGIVPLFELMADAGCRIDWLSEESYWKPRTNEWGQTTCSHIFAAGDVQGVGGAKAARIRGILAALEIAARALKISEQQRDLRAGALRRTLKRFLSLRPLMVKQFPEGLSSQLPGGDTIICRCEEITAKRIHETRRAGAISVNQVKSLTRCGMGPCQGKICAATVSRMMSHMTEAPTETVGPYRARFPGRPLSLGQLAQMTVAPKFVQNGLLNQQIDKPQLVEN